MSETTFEILAAFVMCWVGEEALSVEHESLEELRRNADLFQNLVSRKFWASMRTICMCMIWAGCVKDCTSLSAAEGRSNLVGIYRLVRLLWLWFPMSGRIWERWKAFENAWKRAAWDPASVQRLRGKRRRNGGHRRRDYYSHVCACWRRRQGARPQRARLNDPQRR